MTALAVVVNYYGSSPRGRGTQSGARDVGADRRFIPARAGNTNAAIVPRPTAPVHPRAGGEHASAARRRSSPTGSSPRGRGTLQRFGDGGNQGRFIPARAGNTTFSTPMVGRSTVHPRAGGEHRPHPLEHRTRYGSSPRGRGTLRPGAQAMSGPRFIPARAGYRSAIARATAVHPRAGGEHIRERFPLKSPAGSSPRGRGPHARHGVKRLNTGSSPRGRGTPVEFRLVFVPVRFIPARAGNTSQCPRWPCPRPVHPRAGGEHSFSG